MIEKTSGVYKITNNVTGDFYIGSNKNINKRWISHKSKAVWNQCPNKTLYRDMQKYGIDKFKIEILAHVEAEYLKQEEQKFIEILKPVYNNNNAKGMNVEKLKVASRKYHKKRDNQLCVYNGETLKLAILINKFRQQGIPQPTQEAKKYLTK